MPFDGVIQEERFKQVCRGLRKQASINLVILHIPVSHIRLPTSQTSLPMPFVIMFAVHIDIRGVFCFVGLSQQCGLGLSWS